MLAYFLIFDALHNPQCNWRWWRQKEKNPNVQLFAEYVSNLYLSKEEKAFFWDFHTSIQQEG